MRLPWKFSATKSKASALKASRDYSQHGEQPIILRYFSERQSGYSRYFVDAGAFDGVVGSNSRALFELGWAGMVIEPNPRVFQRLAKLYKKEPRVACVNLALSDHPETGVEMLFSVGPAGVKEEDKWQYGQVSTLHGSFAEQFRRDHGYQYAPSRVDLTTLAELFSTHRSPPDLGFLSIDCEGEDLKVLQGAALDQFRPRLLCVECDDRSRHIYQEFLQGRYRHYDHTRGNTFFALLD